MTKKLTTATIGAVALSIAFSAPAFADMAYAPAELSTEHGAMDVYERIQATAVNTCDSRLNHDSVIKSRKVRDRCVSDVVDQLVHKVNDPRIEKIHNEHKAGI
ncbi:UrcA family protein [Hyphococcus sp.]|uniref:UrcA family protein n=1 Tax=Hyphococcus sp. TaxID=2038636 RepID=UPI0035C6C9FD